MTLAVNLGSFAYLVLVARSASPAVFGALAALAGITLLFEVPANALQVAVGRALDGQPRQSPSPDASPQGGSQALAGTRERLGPRRLCRAAGPVATGRAVPSPAVDHQCLAARCLRAARRGERGTEGSTGRSGPPAPAGHRPPDGIGVRIVLGVLLVRTAGV